MPNQAEFPVQTLARSMGVSRSGFYAWQTREPSARDIADRELTELIRQIHAASGKAMVRHASTLDWLMPESMSLASVSNGEPATGRRGIRTPNNPTIQYVRRYRDGKM
ncbi:hypothetical protein [Oceaniradius stylonematis]|nr:hypothetical protein [Oceaniradius stylonematis]